MKKQTQTLLTGDEEKELATRWREHGDRKALDRLITCNQGLACKVARAWARSGVPIEDLVQMGLMGVMEAAKRFDPERGTRFSCIAMPWIWHEISIGVVGESMIELPAHAARILPALKKACAELRERHICITPEAVQARVKELRPMDRASLETVKALLHGMDCYSLDRHLSPAPFAVTEGQSFLELLQDDSPSALSRLEQAEDDRAVIAAVTRLPARKQKISKQRYVKDASLEKIGNGMDLSRERIRQLQNESLDQVHRHLTVGPAEQFDFEDREAAALFLCDE